MIRLVAIVFLLLPGVASAQDWPEHQDLFVNDFANVIGDEAEARIRTSLQGLKTETGIETTVLTLHTRWGYGESGQSFEEFATGLFNAWGIGDAEANTGILLLVISEDRKIRIELGRGYGRKFNDEAAAIIQEIMVPAFQAGDMSKGIEDGTTATIERVARGYIAGSVPASTSGPGSDEGGGAGGLGLGAIIAAIAALFIGSRWLKGRKRCPECGKRGLKRKTRTLTKATRTSKGEGEETLSCKHCGYAATALFMIPMISDAADSSSSGGDFGGGSSDGGGASGDW